MSVSSIFYSLANQILNERILVVNGIPHIICEIEFYLHDSSHPDPYIHCHPHQMVYTGLYFHKFKNKFKGGTFKGLDLCLGRDGQHFGILIRSIMKIPFQLITGPCNVVNYILKLYDVSSIDELVGKDEPLNFMNNWRELILVSGSVRRECIYSGPRIGLNNKYEEWAKKDYRFSIIKKGLKQNSKLKLLN